MRLKFNPKVHLDLSCEYEPSILPNTKIGAAKDYGEKCMKVRPPSFE